MATAEIGTRLTPSDLLALPDGDRFELVGGELLETSMGAESSRVGLLIAHCLLSHVLPARLGHVFGPDCGYTCFPADAGKVRRPDVSFIRAGRLPGDAAPSGYILIAPDLAVEVVSPNDTAAEVEQRVEDFLSAGTPLQWVVYPETRRVHLFRRDGSTARLGASEELSGEEVVPGFRCRLTDLFPA